MKTKVYSAAIWTIISFGASRAIQLISNLILTRLLFPEAFGIMALINVYLIGLGLLSDVGLKVSVIRSDRGSDPAFLNTVWTLNVIRGFVLMAIGIAIAYPVSVLYAEPILFGMLCFCSLRSLLDGFVSPGVYLAQRELRLMRFVVWQVGAQLIGLITTVLLAIELRSVWALAIGSVVAGTANVILSHLLFRRRYQFSFERSAFLELFSFGKWVLLGTMMTYFAGQGLRAIEGIMVDSEVLGLIYIAALLAGVLEQAYKSISGQVVFPFLSEINRNQDQNFFARFERARMYTLVPAVFALCLVSLVSNQIVELLYDPRFSLAGDYLKIIALSLAVGTLPALYGDALLTKGNSRSYAKFMSIRAFSIIIASICGFHLGGIEFMLWGQVIGGIVVYLYSLTFARAMKVVTLKIDVLCLVLIFFMAHNAMSAGFTI